MLDVQGSGREWFRWRIAKVSWVPWMKKRWLGIAQTESWHQGAWANPCRAGEVTSRTRCRKRRFETWSGRVESPHRSSCFFLATHCSSISAPSISKPHHRGSLRVFEMCPRFLPHQSMAPRVTLQPRCITMLAGARPQQRQDALTVASRLADASLGSAITDKPDMEV